MKNKIVAKWVDQLHFEATMPGGVIHLDGDSQFGGQDLGVRSKALMLTSLAGCTGMDVASLLKKMRAIPESFSVEVVGELTDVHPKYYHKVHITYKFYGKEFKKEKIEKSVNLSLERYCGVSAMFRNFAKLTHEIQYLDAE